MNNKNAYILDDRAILYINGEDVKEFLQNLISNDINKISDVNSCFSSLLTPQGKFLYEFIIVKHKSGYLLDCEKPQAEELFKQLSLYKLRSKVEILNLSNEFVVAAFSHEKFLTFKKVSISVVCSRWEEPFGRTSLEAASRGSAVIISNRGGLPETTNSAIILKNYLQMKFIMKSKN